MICCGLAIKAKKDFLIKAKKDYLTCYMYMLGLKFSFFSINFLEISLLFPFELNKTQYLQYTLIQVAD